jgi:hypothetical protein
MSDETIRDFIERREMELQRQIGALKAKLAATTAELDELLVVRNNLGEANARREEEEIFAFAMAPGTTIKEMVVQALLDRFPKGATLLDIRDFIHVAYGRDITPSSLRTQMHRLKTDQVLGHDPSTDTWDFRDGKRRLYAMYNHPASRNAMRELKDEPSASDPNTAQPTQMAELKLNSPNSD